MCVRTGGRCATACCRRRSSTCRGRRPWAGADPSIFLGGIDIRSVGPVLTRNGAPSPKRIPSSPRPPPPTAVYSTRTRPARLPITFRAVAGSVSAHFRRALALASLLASLRRSAGTERGAYGWSLRVRGSAFAGQRAPARA